MLFTFFYLASEPYTEARIICEQHNYTMYEVKGNFAACKYLDADHDIVYKYYDLNDTSS